MRFPQLGGNDLFVGGSTAELLSIVSTAMFKRLIAGTDGEFELVNLPPPVK